MELTIKLLSGRSAGKEIKVPSNKFLIGRAEDCHLRPHSDLVSRHHCVLLIEEGFCAVRDFGSKNGTLVNEERVVGQRELKHGDKLRIGNLEFEVQTSCEVGGKKRPKVKDVKEVAQRTAAGPARGGEDDDVSDWLSDGDDSDNTRRVDASEKKRPHHETPAVSMSNRETTFMKKSPTDETTTVKPIDAKDKATKPPEESTPDATKAAEAANRLFGAKLAAAQPKNAPKDSREAANEALKKFFGAPRKP
jgi:pSer/pThr/pTyr-binding forkhead associated (FHA) protein